MGNLNGILVRVGGNLNNNFQKSQIPGGLPEGGMLKLRFDRYIIITCKNSEGVEKSLIYVQNAFTASEHPVSL